ncbi:dynamin family protein [Frankia sp. Mgl5]|uniref:dynamin family protein n=1 Tax=Frankia sp. Mgl5 TaxID=2933793 RepID=UPI00200CB2D4|nr:dynamin family protein [Frankia sp. Mgl5]MCK9931769.1 dynamin family protein [Frankia sp. Mgl5]
MATATAPGEASAPGGSAAPGGPAGPKPDPAAHPLAGEVVAWAGEAADAVAGLGRPQAAEAIRAELGRTRSGAATVVVVGEKKRGKSSLINALVGRRGLLPVDEDVATSVHLVLRHAEEPTAWVSDAESPTGREIPLSDVGEYAALDPLTGQARRRGVTGVEVGLPDPLLAKGMAVVDTPGVGGLVSGHAEITLATLARADALVFVVNGSSELTASECRFLEQATERIATVLFVLTQTDKYPGWRQVLDRNRALIATHAPRYTGAPWFAVSSREKLDAAAERAAGDGQLADTLLASSGFPALEAALVSQVAARAGALRLANVLTVTRPPLAQLAAERAQDLRSLNRDPTLVAEVTRRQQQLKALADQGAGWRGKLTGDVKALDREIRREYQRRVNKLRSLADRKIAEGGPDVLRELPGDLEAGVQGIWMDLETMLRQRITQIVRELGRTFDADGFAGVGVELAMPDGLRTLPSGAAGAAGTAGGPSVADQVERAVTSVGIGALFAKATAFVIGGIAAPVAAGLGIWALITRQRKNREEVARARGDARRYVNDVIAAIQTEVPSALQDALDRAISDVQRRVAAELEQTRRRLEQQLAEHRQNLKAAEEELTRKRAVVQQEIDTLTALNGQADSLAAQLAVHQ